MQCEKSTIHLAEIKNLHCMAIVAQLVRASGCDSEGRGFEPLHSPQKNI